MVDLEHEHAAIEEIPTKGIVLIIQSLGVTVPGHLSDIFHPKTKKYLSQAQLLSDE